MPEFSFVGTQELMELIQLLPELALDAGQPAMVDTTHFIHGLWPEYPPAIPDSTYRRRVSGGLGGAFTEATHLEGEAAVIGEVGNIMPYAPWVVGEDFPGELIGGQKKYQAQVHVDRWWQVGTVIEAHERDIWDVFEQKFWPEFRDRIQQATKTGGQHG